MDNSKVVCFKLGTGQYAVGTEKTPERFKVVHRDKQAEDQEPMKAGDWLILDGEKIIRYGHHYVTSKNYAMALMECELASKKPVPEKFTMAEIKKRLFADSFSSSKGVFTVKKNFFYPGRLTDKTFASQVRKAVKGCEILDSGVVWKQDGQSHWFVKFKA